MFRGNSFVLSAIVGLLLLTLSGTAQSDIPKMISYQGKATDTGGTPVTDGTYTMRFFIYDAVTGGAILWDSGAQPVNVSDGIFSVLLGEAPQPMIDLDFDLDYWLLVRFNGVDQTPRQRLASIGYAYMASGLVAGTEVIGSVSTGTSSAIKGTNTATSGYRNGVYGESAANSGSGVYGRATSPTGYTYGGTFGNVSTLGGGIFAYALATTGDTWGVFGQTYSPSGKGVYGLAQASTGTAYGGYFESNSSTGTGVYGKTTNGTGVHGYSTAGTGVYGKGRTYGIYGTNPSNTTGSTGVFGYATATTGYTYGVYGQSSSPLGTGVYGRGLSYGVYGQTYRSVGWGVLGRAPEYGVYGEATATSGTSYAGRFVSIAPFGTGVEGQATAAGHGNYGVAGLCWSASGFGVYGWNDGGGPAVYAAGNFGASGTKSCVVRSSQGPTMLYCQESPECWFEDFGEGQLVDGRAHIELDPLFLETVTIDGVNPMKVFVELGDECNGVFVRRGLTGFDVIELQGGFSSVPFCYRVVAKRKGFEEKRLDYCKAAETDPNLYPEVREKLLLKHEEERARMKLERVRMAGATNRVPR